MKQKLLALLMPFMLCGIPALAHDIEVGGIYYVFTNNGTELSVSYKGNSYSSYSNEYSGTMVIPSSVTYNGTTYPVTGIRGNAFRNCSNLTSVTIPNSVTSIEEYAFSGCSGLIEVHLPKNWTSSFVYVFERCLELKKIYVNTQNVLSRQIKAAFSSRSQRVNIEEIVIEGSVESIQDNAFDQWGNSLKRVFINSNAVASANYSSSSNINTRFGYNVEEYIIGEGVEAIGDWAFSSYVGGSWEGFDGDGYRPVGFTAISLPSTLKKIGEYAFWHSNHLESIHIPASVESIGRGAFDGCCTLKQIDVDAENLYYDSRNECNAIVESASNTLLRGCQYTTIPKSVTAIGDYAFDWCQGMKSIVLPEHISNIGEGAFFECKDLRDIYVLKSSPVNYHCSWGNYGTNRLFYDVPKDLCTLHVPAGSKERYASTAPWSDFLNIVEDGDLQPLENDEVIDFATEDGLGENPDLSGNVIGNIFYNIIPENGSFVDGCIVMNKPTSDESVQSSEGVDIFGEDFKNNFTGIVFKVPAGTGTVKVTAETTGNTTLKVKIGTGAPIEMELSGKLKASFPFMVETDSYVFIYAGQTSGTSHSRLADAHQNQLKIYSVEWQGTPTAITKINDDGPTVESIYDLQGRRVTNPKRGQLVIVRYSDGTSKKVLVQ